MEDVRLVYCGLHYIRTTVTATPSVVCEWIDDIRNRNRYRNGRGRLVVGLGVQWVPGSTRAATLQLCAGFNCLIFQLFHASHFPYVLRRFLVDPGFIFVGIYNHSDASMLKESHHDVDVGPLVDVRDVARLYEEYSRNASMGTMAAEILGLRGMEKEEWVGRSDWDDAQLSLKQVDRVCVP